MIERTESQSDKPETLTSSVENSINLAFVQQLWVLCLDGFELDCNFLSCGHVCSKVNITEGTTPNLAAEPVLLSHSELHACNNMYTSPAGSIFPAGDWIQKLEFDTRCSRRHFRTDNSNASLDNQSLLVE